MMMMRWGLISSDVGGTGEGGQGEKRTYQVFNTADSMDTIVSRLNIHTLQKSKEYNMQYRTIC